MANRVVVVVVVVFFFGEHVSVPSGGHLVEAHAHTHE